MRADLIRGHLDLLVLSVVATGATHGYGVVEEIRRRSGGAFDLPEGTVYPALYRLEGTGLLTSDWREVGGRRRRTYRLTRAGRRALAGRMREWSSFVGAVTRVISRTAWAAPA